MNRFILSALLLLCLPGLHAQLSVKNTQFFSQGDFLLGFAPCFGFWGSADPESVNSGSNSLNVGLKARGEYFFRDNLSARANVGISHDRSSFRNFMGEEFINTEGICLYELGLYYYPPMCLFGDGEASPSLRPYGGINLQGETGGRRFRSDLSESRDVITGIGATATLGLMVALKSNLFMGVEGNVLGFSRRNFSLPDGGGVISQQNQFYFALNKAILAMTFSWFLNAE